MYKRYWICNVFQVNAAVIAIDSTFVTEAHAAILCVLFCKLRAFPLMPF